MNYTELQVTINFFSMVRVSRTSMSELLKFPCGKVLKNLSIDPQQTLVEKKLYQ